MELCPRFEAYPTRPLPSRFSLRRLLTIDEKPVASPYPEWARSVVPLDVPFERQYPWRAFRRDGVWIVANPFTFLDRVRPISPVPYLRAERFLARIPAEPDAPSWLSGRRVLEWKQLNDLVRELGTDADRLTLPIYRNVPSWTFSRLVPLTRFAERIPDGERTAFWKASKDKDEPAKIAVNGGELTVRTSTFANHLGGPNAAGISWSWRGEDGSLAAGNGTLDAKGLGD